MTEKEYDYWLDKIQQDAEETAVEMCEAFPQISPTKWQNIWITTHTNALNYLIKNHKEVNAYTLADTSSDIINGRITV